MRNAVMAVCLLILGAGQAWSQSVTGRSNTGSLSVVAPEIDPARSGKNKFLTFDVEFSEPSGNKYLDAKETGRLRLVISNSGKFAAKGVVAKVVPVTEVAGITFNDSILVGDIPVNATRYAIFYFAASEKVPAQVATFQVVIREAKGEAMEPKLLTFLTREQRAEE